MNKFHLLSHLVPCVAVAVVMSGCDPNSGLHHKVPQKGQQLRLGFVTNSSSGYWTAARKGVEKAASQLSNVSVEFKLPGDGVAADQRRFVDDLLAEGIDGIAISPIDPTNQISMLNKAAAQTLVFTQDSDAPQSQRACYIGADNVAAGRQAGEMLRKALPLGGEVMIFVGKLDAQNASERYSGIKAALRGSNLKILDVRTDGNDHAKARSNVSDALVKYPDLVGCIGLWSYNGPAILSAVKDAHKVGKVKIVCFDQEEDTLAGVQSGAIEATIVQQPYEFGYRSIIDMARYLRGDKSFIPPGKKIYVPTKIVTRATVAAFRAHAESLGEQ